ncbi:MAG: hypothetical protein N2V75_06735 [Methanophagales archaeon]|nr:hypothetical protein [Methanophagales archaeon]
MEKVNRKQRLHGWDDEKIYFWDEEKGKEWCVTDEEELYNQLLGMCVEYFKKKMQE